MKMAGHNPGDLSGRCLLIVEDEYFVAKEIVEEFESRGAEIIGPASTVKLALDLIERSKHLDGAVIDINLQGEMTFPVADLLRDRGIPFVFTTGYDSSIIPERYGLVPRFEKPIDPAAIARILF
jgi:CheY-like chemotaxis protein